MDHEIEELSKELSQWREAHAAPKRIHENIWSRAIAAAEKLGVTPISKALKLDYGALKRRMQAPICAGSRTTEFIELFQPAPNTQALVDCVVAIQSSRGARLRVEAKNLPVSLGGPPDHFTTAVKHGPRKLTRGIPRPSLALLLY